LGQRGFNPRLKFFWTAEQDRRLRAMYAEAKSRKALTAGIDDLSRRFGFPRHIIRLRAQKFAITVVDYRRWTEDELAYLRENAGQVPVSAMIKRLRRNFYSISSRIRALGLSRDARDGYSIANLTEVLGVSYHSVAKWIAAGWIRLGINGRFRGRASEDTMRAFLHRHAEEYDLRRVDQAWFKGMVFADFGALTHFRPARAERIAEEFQVRA